MRRKKKQRAEDVILERVLAEKEPLKEPACVHFPDCGGCTCQQLSYQDQLFYKEQLVRELVTGVLPEAEREVFSGVEPSPLQFGYRNKMEFSFGDTYKGGPLALGLHRRNGHYDIVNVCACQIVDQDFREIRQATLDYFGALGIPYFHHVTHEGYLRHLLIRKGHFTGEILVDLITTTQAAEDIDVRLQEWCSRILKLQEEGKLSGNIAGILHTSNDAIADVVKDEGTDVLYGCDYFFEQSLGLQFKVTPFSFFQTNSAGAERLYDIARSYVREVFAQNRDDLRDVVYDLYSGTGTIAQILSPAAGSVIGVEIVEEAVEAARENAARNGLKNCTFLAGDVLKTLDGIAQKPTFIVLDPPREGIHPKALRKILDYGLPYVLYISCKPTSLARDLEAFLGAGYRVERMRGVDMFPGTRHCEIVVSMSRAGSRQ